MENLSFRNFVLFLIINRIDFSINFNYAFKVNEIHVTKTDLKNLNIIDTTVLFNDINSAISQRDFFRCKDLLSCSLTYNEFQIIDLENKYTVNRIDSLMSLIELNTLENKASTTFKFDDMMWAFPTAFITDFNVKDSAVKAVYSSHNYNDLISILNLKSSNHVR